MSNKNHTIDRPHCSSCAATDHESVNCGDEGYSQCCNKRICHGGAADGRYGTPEHNVLACCWGGADTADNPPREGSRMPL